MSAVFLAPISAADPIASLPQRYLDEIDTELARRETKRLEAGSFIDFLPGSEPLPRVSVFYHEDLCATLQRIESGEIKRAMFFLPLGRASRPTAACAFRVGIREQTLVLALDDRIALAYLRFQLGTIKYGNVAAAVMDQPRLLQR